MRQQFHVMTGISADSSICSDDKLIIKLLEEKIQKAMIEVLEELGDPDAKQELHYVDYEWGEPC